MRAPLVPITLAFLLGIVLAHSVPIGSAALSLLSVGGIAALLAAVRRVPSPWTTVALLLAWGCLGAGRMVVWQLHPDTQLAQRLGEEPQPVRLHGVVRDDPVMVFEPNEEPSQRCVIELRQVDTGTGWRPAVGRVWTILHEPRLTAAYGDELLLEGGWSRIPSPGNPGQYDWRASLARQRVHGLVRVAPFDAVVVQRQGQGHPVVNAIYRLRRRWSALLAAHFPDREAGLLRSMLLGERTTLDDRLRDAFVETGTIHLLVISGFNVAVVAGLLELVWRLVGMPWGMRVGLLAAGLGGYSVLTGLQPPVVRATLMAWVVLGALALGRVLSWPNTLAAAALLILWVNPAQLFDPGFQLSFGAVLSLMVFTPRWVPWLERSPHLFRRRLWRQRLHGGRKAGPPPAGKQVGGWARRYLALSIGATAAIWTGLSPVLAFDFHLLSPISVIANLLIAPLMSALIAVGTGILLLGTILEPIVGWSQGVLELVLRATLTAVAWCHAVPGGYWYVGRPSAWMLAGYYGLILLSLARGRLGWTTGRVLIAWSAAAAVWLWSLVATEVASSRWLQVDVLDVGHGDSLLIRTPRGLTVLVDGGTREAGQFRVVPYLRASGIRRLDAVLLTHWDEDHIGGVIPVLEEVGVGCLLTNGAWHDTMSARAIERLVASRQIPVMPLGAGVMLEGDAGVVMDVLHPPRGLVPGTPPGSNDNSVVLKVTRGSISLLFCGDLEEGGLPWLLEAGDRLRSTVLKVPHHGSRLGAVGERFFDAVQPQVALLSVGRLHHLPAPETLGALERTGAALYTTRDDGAVRLRTDGERLEMRTVRTRKHLRSQKVTVTFREK